MRERERERDRDREGEREKYIYRDYQETHCSFQLKLDRRLLLPPLVRAREWFRFVTDSVPVRDWFVERKSRNLMSYQDLIFRTPGER